MRLVVTLILLAGLIVFISYSTFPVLPSYFYQTIILVWLGTVGVYFYLLDVKKNRSEYFVQFYMVTLFAKILAYGAYMLFVVWDDTLQAANNVLIFMITYLAFTAVEIIFLYLKVSR